MRKLLIFLLLLWAFPVWSQTTKNGRIQTGNSTAKPATCSGGDQFNAIDTFQLFLCGPANTWTASAGCTSPSIDCTFGTPFTSMSAYAQAQLPAFSSLDAAGRFGISAINQNGIAILYDGTSDGMSPGEAINAYAVCGAAIPTSAGCGGVNGYAYVNASSTLSKAWGVSGFWQKDGAGTLADAYGIWATKGIKNTGTVTRNSGVFISDQHGLGTTNYGLRIEDQGTTSDAHAILAGGQSTLTYGSTSTTAKFPFEFFAPTIGDLGDGTGASMRLALQDENGQGFAVTNSLCVTNCGYMAMQINMANQGGFTLWDGGSNYPSLHLGIVAGEASLSGGPGSTGDIGARVDNTGFARISFTSPIYNTATNCKGNGTAASPSVVSCSAASAGMFSCATNASTATCQVNTTAVTANSEISITQDAADGGASQLNVTCNTTNVLNTSKPLLVSKNAGVSFTINLGTVTTNPACFEYRIVN